ncbi:thiamine-phosphate kinase [Acetobacter sp. AN02]|uniref:thiamine-phosphate kinase n=1 Tax=Acetobacter sp. AN02 TaxID=2894186 RepID=UPI0024344C64|nr:thiamine-phosphate kinase [Acetobacter sp. AN02]MDG6095343.1 thiamine-phosphate kinase [Acetobacter sp. AN02]
MTKRRPEGDGSSGATDLPREFSFIRRHFRQLAAREALDLTDDAAVFAPPPGREIVIAADAMVENVHFLPGDPPSTIGRKLLRANLSDMAAMAAIPFAWLLTVALPAGFEEAWFAEFCTGLAEDQRLFGVGLLGGDTTSTTGPLALSLTILGHCAPGQALLRSGAAEGDSLWVTGTLGDGALGLRALRGEIADPTGWLTERYHLPRPRLGMALAGVTSAAIDISDGLVQDAGHLARESGLALRIEAARLPLSDAARAAGDTAVDAALCGGDDYELLLAVPPEKEAELQREAERAGVAVTRIGMFSSGSGVTVYGPDNRPMVLQNPGWSHIGNA